MTPTTP
ncbi:hypothetical protein YPPY71_1125, partial [Yersinia pestis PY-71]